MAYEIAYRLSNRQRKDLFVRATRIRVAIPAPHDDEGIDIRAYILAVLDIEDDTLESVEETEICHEIPIHAAGEGLTQLLGNIVERDSRAATLTSVVYVATLAFGRVRHDVDKLQWPGAIVVNGEVYPRSK